MSTAEKSKKTPEGKVGHKKSEGEKSKELKIQVHSANAWEAADLGDTDRKNKFLRLMGAGKKEHRGRFVIGDHEPAHTRPSKDTENLEHNLEDQYQQSLAHRMAGGRRGHIGLGFHNDEDSSEGEGNNKELKDKDSRDSQEQKDDDDPECGAEGEPGSAGEPDEDDDEEKEAEKNVDDGKRGKDCPKKRGSSSSSKEDESNMKKMKFVKGSS